MFISELRGCSRKDNVVYNNEIFKLHDKIYIDTYFTIFMAYLHKLWNAMLYNLCLLHTVSSDHELHNNIIFNFRF